MTRRPDPGGRVEVVRTIRIGAAAALAAMALACAAERHYVRPNVEAYAVSTVALFVRAAAEPTDAVRGIEFGATFPALLRLSSPLPVDPPAAAPISAAIADALAEQLATRGYRVVRPSEPASTVEGALEVASANGATGALCVVYTPVHRWPVARLLSTAGAGSPTAAARDPLRAAEIRVIESDVLEGLLVLPTAALYEARSGLRLWERSRLGAPREGRLDPSSPLVALAFVRGREAPPDADREAKEVARRLGAGFFDSVPRSASAAAADVDRWRTDAAIDRFLDRGHLFVAVGVVRAEEPVLARAVLAPGTAPEPLPAAVDAGGASGPELEISYLGGTIGIGVGVAGLTGGRPFARTFVREAGSALHGTPVSVAGTSRLEVTIHGSAVWVARPWLVLLGGVELRGGRVKVGVEPAAIVDAERLTAAAGATIEATVLWRSLFLGPTIAGGALLDGNRVGPYLRWGARAGWRF